MLSILLEFGVQMKDFRKYNGNDGTTENTYHPSAAPQGRLRHPSASELASRTGSDTENAGRKNKAFETPRKGVSRGN
jgi:hypothetical protein